MNTITREGTTLFSHLCEIAAQGTQQLINSNYYDPLKEGPNVEKIEGVIEPFLQSGKHVDLPDEKLGWIVDHQAASVATAFQGLGDLDIASLWYQIGQFGWRGKAHWYEGNILDLDWNAREGPSIVQEGPAICAALANNASRAEQLFRYIAQNMVKTDLELQAYEEARDYNQIWQSLGILIFALMWLGDQWTEVHRLSEIGRRVIEKTRKAGFPKDFREPQLLIGIGWHLSSYFLNPNDETRKIAIESLRLDKMHDREDHTRSMMLRYIFALGHRYPEVNPYPEEGFRMGLWRPSMTRRDMPPTRDEFKNALADIFRQAEQQKKYYVIVSSTALHLRVGGYPGINHRLKLCCEVMRDELKRGGKIIGQTLDPEVGWLNISYSLPRSR